MKNLDVPGQPQRTIQRLSEKMSARIIAHPG